MAADATQTIEYPMLQNTTSGGVSSTTDISSGSKTIYIAETTSRTIVAAWLEVRTVHNPTTMTAATIGLTVGAAGESTVTYGVGTDIVIATGEDYSHVMVADFTSYVNTNFGAGGSQTMVARVNITGPATSNCSVKLFITYNFDKSDSTHTKTVKFFIGSELSINQDPVPVSGTYSIPALDSKLPESTKTIRAWWLETWSGHQSNASDSVIEADWDSGGYGVIGWVEGSSKLHTPWHILYDRTGESTSSIHTVRYQDNGGAGLDTACTILCVTYEFASTSTTQLKTIEAVVGFDNETISGTSPLPQSNGIIIPETSPVEESVWLHVVGHNDMITGTCTIKGQGEPTGRVYTVTQTKKDNYRELCHDITSLVTLAQGNNVIMAQLTNSAAALFNGRTTIAFITYKYTYVVSDPVNTMVKYMVGQDSVTGFATFSTALTMNIPGGNPHEGYVKFGHNWHYMTATLTDTTETPEIDGTAGLVMHHSSDKEGMLVENFQDVMDVLTIANLNSSHTYKNVSGQADVTSYAMVSVVISSKIGVIAAVTKDRAGVSLGSCECVLFKVTGSAPKDHEQIYKTTSDGSGNYSFDIYEAGNYRVVATKAGSPNVFDCTDYVLTEA